MQVPLSLVAMVSSALHMFPVIGQQTAMGHEGHHNIGRPSTINTHSYQPHNFGMVQLTYTPLDSP